MDLGQVIATSPVYSIPGSHWVIRLDVDRAVPSGCFCAVQDGEETTVICREEELPKFVGCEMRGPFALLQCRVAVPFEAPGFLARIASTLAEKQVSVFIVSTFSFDYVLVSGDERDTAIELLRAAGFPTAAGV